MARWYRRLGAREGGAFVDIIDSGDISRWVSKRRWRPREVFNRYAGPCGAASFALGA